MKSFGGPWYYYETAGIFACSCTARRSADAIYIGFLLDLSDGNEFMTMCSGAWSDSWRTGVFVVNLINLRSGARYYVGFLSILLMVGKVLRCLVATGSNCRLLVYLIWIYVISVQV